MLTTKLSTPEGQKLLEPVHKIYTAERVAPPACDWLVFPDSRFKGMLYGVLGVPGSNGEPGVVICAESLAKRIARGKLNKLDQPYLCGQYVRAVTSATTGLDHLLNGISDDIRVYRAMKVTRQDDRNTFNDRETLLQVIEAVTGSSLSGAMASATTRGGNDPAGPSIEAAVQSMGLRHTLMFATLHPMRRTDDFISIPGMDAGMNVDRYATFVDSLTKRQITVHGWDSLVRSTAHLVDEINWLSSDADNFEGITAETLSTVFSWESFGSDKDAFRDPLASVIEAPKQSWNHNTPAPDGALF